MANEIVVYAYVTGDLLHIGHLYALQQAKALGDTLIVGVITDEGVEAYKRKPVIPFRERLELIKNLKCVDLAVAQKTLSPVSNLKKYKADIVVHGDDWDENFPGAEYMRSAGKRAVRTMYYAGQSTSKIIDEVRGG